MGVERAVSRGESDVSVDNSVVVQEIDDVRPPLVDLRTRLVLWILCLFFLSLLYLGLNGPPV